MCVKIELNIPFKFSLIIPNILSIELATDSYLILIRDAYIIIIIIPRRV